MSVLQYTIVGAPRHQPYVRRLPAWLKDIITSHHKSHHLHSVRQETRWPLTPVGGKEWDANRRTRRHRETRVQVCFNSDVSHDTNRHVSYDVCIEWQEKNFFSRFWLLNISTLASNPSLRPTVVFCGGLSGRRQRAPVCFAFLLRAQREHLCRRSRRSRRYAGMWEEGGKG